MLFVSRELWPQSEDLLQTGHLGDAYRQPGIPQGGEERFEADCGAHGPSAQKSEIVAVLDQRREGGQRFERNPEILNGHVSSCGENGEPDEQLRRGRLLAQIASAQLQETLKGCLLHLQRKV